jgi:hypothetical protein
VQQFASINNQDESCYGGIPSNIATPTLANLDGKFRGTMPVSTLRTRKKLRPSRSAWEEIQDIQLIGQKNGVHDVNHTVRLEHIGDGHNRHVSLFIL